MGPGMTVIFYSIALGEGAKKLAGDGARAAGNCVIHEGADQFGGCVGKNFLPVGRRYLLTSRFKIPNVICAFCRNPNYIAFCIKEGVGFLLLKDGKIYFVNFDKLFQRQTEALRNQYVNLDKREAATKLGPNRTFSAPMCIFQTVYFIEEWVVL